MFRGGKIKMRMALTGHRPERLGYPDLDFYTTDEWRKIIEWLKEKIIELNVTDAYCGMASGCDIAYGIAASELKIEGKFPVKLHCILPCKNYNNKISWHSILKIAADEWIELSDEFYKGCDNVRDQYMVDHSDKIFAIWDGNKSGGVWSTIRKAQKKGIDIVYYPKEEL
jgi:uncharacterized phage-like protein YoqJ